MANITTQTIRVDLSTGKVIPTAYTHQNDTARTLVFDIYNGGMPYTMTGNTVKFAYKSPIVNGQYSVIAGASMASGTVSGNKVSVTLPSAYTAVSGVGMLTMIITPTSGTVRPVNIRLVVQKSADGANEVAGASDFPTELQEIAEDWLEENISIQIDDTLSVSGKAADAKVTGDEISELDGQITDLKSDLSDLQNELSELDDIQTASTAAQMTNTGAIYKYTGTETGMVQNALYYHNGETWVQIGKEVEVDATLTQSGVPADAKTTGDEISGLSGRFTESYEETEPSFYDTGKHFALKSSNASHYHAWNGNYNLIDVIGEKESIYIEAVSSYLNYRFLSADPSNMTTANAINAVVVSYGGTYDGYTNLHNTDVNEPSKHRFVLPVPEGATYFLADFGYTQPTNLIYGDFKERYHLYDDAVWTNSIKDLAVTTEKLADESVNNRTIKDDTIESDKIKDDAITALKLNVGFRNNVSLFPDNKNVRKVGTGWESYIQTLRIASTYPNGVLWEYHCEEGKYYRIFALPNTETRVTPTNPDGASNVNSYGFITNTPIEPIVGAFTKQDGYLASSWVYGLPQSLDPEYATIFEDNSAAYTRNTFRCEKDMWFYWCSSRDVSDEYPFIGCYSFYLMEQDAPSQGTIDTNSWNGTNANKSVRSSAKYVKSFSGFATEGTTTSRILDEGLRDYHIPKDFAELIAKPSRDPSDNHVNALLIGDSITYAASNAGLQNAWRKYISTRLNLGEIALAVSGTGIITGAPYDFKGNAKTSENYNEELSGYQGIKHWIKARLGMEEDQWSLRPSGSSVQQNASEMAYVSIAIVALGTNDWSSNGTLGSVDTIDDDTTFYGAVQMTYTLLHDTIGIPVVLFVAPFKRANWNQPNSATVPYTIYDMCHALAEIACINSDMHVLDCLDRWYLDYDDTDIRSRSFIDTVHIKPYAHHMFTMDLAKEIRAILSAKGVI